MNHSEFSNTDNSKFFYTYKDGLRALFRFAQKSPAKEIYWGERVFE